ncbi:MAG: UbiA family prenyltransferase [Saprospiraceae bacterium]
MIIYWLQLIRWKNLVLILITQSIIYFSFFRTNPNEVYISNVDVLLFILCTLIIAAGGFVINDLFDQKADFINRPFNKCIVGNWIGISEAVRFYYIISILGALIAIYLSIKTKFYYSYLIYPCSLYLFWIYTKYLKGNGFLGNIFVSLFIAAVVLIMPYLFNENLEHWHTHDPLRYTKTITSLSILATFSFLINLFREIVKAIEDEPGDRLVGCKTAPVKFGIPTCLMIARFIWILLFIFTGILFFQEYEHYSNFYFVIFILLPQLILAYYLFLVKIPDYTLLSKIAKINMPIGLLYFCLI